MTLVARVYVHVHMSACQHILCSHTHHYGGNVKIKSRSQYCSVQVCCHTLKSFKVYKEVYYVSTSMIICGCFLKLMSYCKFAISDSP